MLTGVQTLRNKLKMQLCAVARLACMFLQHATHKRLSMTFAPQFDPIPELGMVNPLY